MAKRELSSTLRNLKFMQRVSQKEEQTKKAEDVTPDGNFPSSSTPQKCVVIMEGDPRPGAIKGRMSFQSFNPSIDKLNGEAVNVRQPEGSTVFSGSLSREISDRENGSVQDGSESLKLDSYNIDANVDLKRKQAEGVSEIRYPNKSPKNAHGDEDSTTNDGSSSHKQPKREKLDWNVLRPPKSQNKRG